MFLKIVVVFVCCACTMPCRACCTSTHARARLCVLELLIFLINRIQNGRESNGHYEAYDVDAELVRLAPDSVESVLKIIILN